MTEYMISFNDEWVPTHTPEQIRAKDVAVRAVVDEMKEADVFVFGNGGLNASCLVASVTAEGGRPIFTDGPYAESKEHLGGFCVIRVPDDETARHWAGRVAVALDWPQELHRFPPGPPSEHRPDTPATTDEAGPHPPNTDTDTEEH